jgi:hypothetical protein
MKTRIARIGFCLIAIVTVCSAADNPPSVPSNHFSKWSGQSTNLTVAKPCPPWGCSIQGTTSVYVSVDPEKERSRQVARKALATHHELLRQAQRLERQPNLSTVDHVSLSRQNERLDSGWRVGYGE